MIRCQTKQWGNSLGLIVPRSVVQELHLKPHEEITLEIHKKSTVLKELFGALDFKQSTKKLLKDARMELESKL